MSVRLRNPLCLVAWLACLLPGRRFEGRVDWVFAFAVVVVGATILITKPSPWETRRSARRAAVFFGLLFVLCALSYAYSTAFNGVLTGPLDLLELLRPLVLGVFAVHLIRHYEEHVRADLEAALTVSLYAASFYVPASEYGYTAVLALCWLLFFSRARLRLLHAGAAILLIGLFGGRPAWAAALLVVSAALAARLYENLVAGRARYAAQLTLLSFVLLLAVPVVGVRALSGGGSPDATASGPSTADALLYVRRSPVLGWGPARYEPASAVEEQYASWALRWGAAGLALILGGLVFVAWNLIGAAGGDVPRVLGAWAFVGGVALLLLSGKFLDSDRLFFLTALLVAAMSEGGSSS